MRQQRTHLQHEVDILTQTLNQELLTLNDSVRGLFNDRNMAVREEQKAVESAVSGNGRKEKEILRQTSLHDNKPVANTTPPPSDPTNQLQNEHPPQQRQQIRNRRRAMDPHPPLRRGPPVPGRPDARHDPLHDVPGATEEEGRRAAAQGARAAAEGWGQDGSQRGGGCGGDFVG